MFCELGRQYTYVKAEINQLISSMNTFGGWNHSQFHKHLDTSGIHTQRGKRARQWEQVWGISLPWIQLQMEDLWDWPNLKNLLRTGLPSSVPVSPNLIVFVNIWNNRLRLNLCLLLGGQGNSWQPTKLTAINQAHVRKESRDLPQSESLSCRREIYWANCILRLLPVSTLPFLS